MSAISTAAICDFFARIGVAYRYNNVAAEISSPAPLNTATASNICWVKSKLSDPSSIEAGVIILPMDLQYESDSKALFHVENPRLTYARIVKEFFAGSPLKGVVLGHIHESVVVPDSLYLGLGSIIEEGCTLGENVTILENVVIHSGITIGDNVTIQSGAVIGSQGFGFIKNERSLWEHFPHIGGVILEADVEIGANSCVDRAALGNTIIGAGTKVSNLCQIAHNVIIGKNCLITGKAQIGGGTVIGDDVYIGPSAIISNQIKIGSNADVKLGSIVIEDVADGESVSGNFAYSHKKNLKDFYYRARGKSGK